MANLLFLLLLILITVLIIIESVSIRFVYSKELVIEFDLLIFRLILFPSSKKGQKGKKRTDVSKRIKSNFIKAASFKKAIEYLLRFSKLKIEKIDLKLSNSDPAEFVLRAKNLSTVIYVLITYLSLKTESIITEDTFFVSPYDEGHDTETHLDVTLKSRLFHIIPALFIFFTETKRKKGKQGKKIVRKQNE